MFRHSRGDWFARVLACVFILLGIFVTVVPGDVSSSDRLLVLGGICFPATVTFAISGWGQHLTVTDLRLVVVTPFRRYDIRRADIAGAHRTDSGHVAVDLTDGRTITIQVGVAETLIPWANRSAAQSRTLDFIRQNVLAEPAITGGPATTWRRRKGVSSLAALAVIAIGTAFVYAETTM
jgi:hypothetical protein